jgi:hypothetical protein
VGFERKLHIRLRWPPETQSVALDEMDIGKTILKFSRCAPDTGLRVPTELARLGKTLLQLDEVGRILDPHFDPNESVRRHASEVLNQRLKSVFTEGKFFSSLLEVRQFIGGCSGRTLSRPEYPMARPQGQTQDPEVNENASKLVNACRASPSGAGPECLVQLGNETPYTRPPRRGSFKQIKMMPGRKHLRARRPKNTPIRTYETLCSEKRRYEKRAKEVGARRVLKQSVNADRRLETKGPRPRLDVWIW